MRTKFNNLNQFWSWWVLHRLYDLGVRKFFIAPGSRSAPLVLALAELKKNYSDIDVHTHFDERSLGFFALGYGKSSGQIPAIITTSGTAVANLLPAMVEAKQSHTPIIAITADRPPELIKCGANQTIIQSGIFSSQQIDSLDLPTPHSEELIDPWLTKISELVTKMYPVHFNFPFREPLYPTGLLEDYSDKLSTREGIKLPEYPKTNDNKIHSINSKKTLVIAGHLTKPKSKLVLDFCEQYQLPLFADVNSQLHFSSSSSIIQHYDILLNNSEFKDILKSIDTIIQFEGRFCSKRLLNWVETFSGEYQIISEFDDYLDPSHKASMTKADFESWISCQTELGFPANELSKLQSYNAAAKHFLSNHLANSFSEITLVRKLTEYLPDESLFFIGNSLSIRLVDSFAHSPKPIRVLSNRGASGIDGLLATAAGSALEQNQCITALLGDTSALYDLTSLALANQVTKDQGIPFVIIVLNNDGGAIFNMLPAKQFESVQETLFQCPHGLHFKSSAEQFGLDYHQPNTLLEFETTLSAAYCKPVASLIEIQLPNKQVTNQLDEINRMFSNQLS